jgi:hypothetical protein
MITQTTPTKTMNAKATAVAQKTITRWLDPADCKTHGDCLQVSNWCHGAFRFADSLGFMEASALFEKAGKEAFDLARKVREKP